MIRVLDPNQHRMCQPFDKKVQVVLVRSRDSGRERFVRCGEQLTVC